MLMSRGVTINKGTSHGVRPARMGRRLRITRIILWAALGLVIAAGAGFAVLAYQPEMAAIARPDPGSFDKALVERGRVLANYGDCTACHTRPDGPPFAGNFPLKTPFGTIYTSNITPDTETGDPEGWAILYRVPRDGAHNLDDARPYSVVTATGERAHFMGWRKVGRRRLGIGIGTPPVERV